MPRCSSSAPASAADLSRELAALATERERFLREGTLADVFAVVYFHVTHLIPTAPLRYPSVTAAQVQGFYAGYTNRAQLPHWQPYLALAGDRRLRHGTDPGALLSSLVERGLTGHITFDLPPALVATRPVSLTWDELAPDFFSLDPLFDRAVHAVFADFDHATRCLGPLRSTHRGSLELGSWLLARFGGSTTHLRHLRRAAWQKARLVTFSQEMPYNTLR